MHAAKPEGLRKAKVSVGWMQGLLLASVITPSALTGPRFHSVSQASACPLNDWLFERIKNIYQSFILKWNVPLGLEEKFLIICFVRVWNVSLMALCDFWDFCGNMSLWGAAALHATSLLSVMPCLSFPIIAALSFLSHHPVFFLFFFFFLFPPGCCASAPSPHSSSCFSSTPLRCLPRGCNCVLQALGGAVRTRGEWRCSTMAHGARCVTTRWISTWPMWCADSWASSVALRGRTVPSLARGKVCPVDGV